MKREKEGKKTNGENEVQEGRNGKMQTIRTAAQQVRAGKGRV